MHSKEATKDQAMSSVTLEAPSSQGKGKDYLITTALPYANNHLHLGHMLEFILADIWTRSLRVRGKRAVFLSAVDAHGTPIMLQAEREACAPETMVEAYRTSHYEDLKAFQIGIDGYYSTHHESSRKWAEQVYSQLKAKGWLLRQSVEQYYDTERAMFLPDRMVKGGCPACGAEDQYGDACEVCGATYAPTALHQPKSSLSGSVPVLRRSENLFLDLPLFTEFLREGLEQIQMHASVKSKLSEWLESGLKPWDISREFPYFGFEIPGEKGKYFYVWLDAPLGYLSATQQYFQQQPGQFEAAWKQEELFEVHQFIGKDIIYFHGLFWPVLLEAVSLRKPTALHVHGHVTLEGRKMSKSRGNFIFAKDYRKAWPVEALRYYFAARLQPGLEDIDLSIRELVLQVNGELINKVINLGSRSMKLLERCNGGRISDSWSPSGLYAQTLGKIEEIEQYYEERRFAKAIRFIVAIADQANQYFDQQKPWKAEKGLQEIQEVCSESIYLFRMMMHLLYPVLPELSEKALACFGEKPDWKQLYHPLMGKQLLPFKTLMKPLQLSD